MTDWIPPKQLSARAQNQFDFSCPACGAVDSAALADRGAFADCPACRKRIRIPFSGVARGPQRRVYADYCFCLDCHFAGAPIHLRPGSNGIEFFLWLLMALPGICYTAWRFHNAGPHCPSCKSARLIPADSPRARELEPRRMPR